jgi:hypothetical protein
VVYGDGSYDGAPAELDPMGGNVGLSTPYIQLYEPPQPTEEFPFLEIFGDSPMYVNGQQVSCTLDGMSVGCSMAMNMLNNGSAIPASIAWAQHLPRFQFTSHGLGIFTANIPYDVFTNNSGRTWAQPQGTLGEGWRIFEGGSSIFSLNWINVSWNPLQQQTRLASDEESESNVQNRPKAKFDREKYAKCLKDLFHTDKVGNFFTPKDKFLGFFGKSQTPFSITFDYSKNREQIYKAIGKKAVGYSPGDFVMTVYIANDISSLDKLATEIHEVGNKIYAKYMGSVGLSQPVRSDGLGRALVRYGGEDFDDMDAGMALEECVFGGRVLKDGTVLK